MGNKIGHQVCAWSDAVGGVAELCTEVQEAIDGTPNDRTGPLLEPVLKPLYAAYAALKKARAVRQPLELDLPERKIVLSETGEVTSVAFRDRLDAHKLIEEFMILANVAAAETLIAKRRPLLFRVHEEPAPEKLESLRETAQAAGLNLAKGQVSANPPSERIAERSCRDRGCGTDQPYHPAVDGAGLLQP